MPVPVLAALLAVVLAAAVALAAPALLRWCPVPEDDVDLAPFADLATPRFRLAVFLVSAFAGGAAFALTSPAHWAAWVPLVSVGALLGLVDLRTTYLPLRLNYLALGLAAAGVAAAAWLDADWAPVIGSAVAGALAAGFFWLMWRLSGDRIGFGDVRLAGLLGVVTGVEGTVLPVWSFLLGSVVGGVWGAVAWLRRGRDGEFAYGPALLLGPLLALVVRRAWQLP